MVFKKIAFFSNVILFSGLVLQGKEIASTASTGPKKRLIVDKTAMTIHGPLRTVHFCESEINRPSVDGRPQQLDDLVHQELVCQDAERLKVAPPEDPEKYLAEIKKKNNLTERDINGLFQQVNRTRSEGARDLAQLYRYNGMIDLKINSRIFISQQEVEEYFHQHPLYTQAEYYLQTALVPFDGASDQKERLSQETSSGEIKALWRDPFWVKEEEISEERHAQITSLKPSQIIGPFAAPGGFELIRLVSKKEQQLIPLEKRYKAIVSTLRQPRYETACKEYHAQLRQEAAVLS